jgi:hypothetical protein
MGMQMVDVPDKNAPFRAAIDSTLAITLARFGMPVVVMLLGYFFSTMMSDLKTGQRDGLNELKEGNRQVWSQVSAIATAQAAANTAQGSLSAKVDGAVKQLDHLQIQVDSLPRK